MYQYSWVNRPKVMMPMNEKNFDYAPENINEEYAFLAGRVKALEDVLSMEDSSFIEKKKGCHDLGA